MQSTKLIQNGSRNCVRPSSRTARKQLRVHASDTFCKDVVNLVREVESQGKTYTVRFLGKGEWREVQVPDNKYILDTAEAAGMDLPATCRAGICGACVARVRKGTVDSSDIQDLSFTLNDEEIAQGMALLCMTRAASDLEIETQCDWGYSLGVAEWKGPSGEFTAEPDPLMGSKWNEQAKN